jgi:cell wall-associated NlpC family hydrolase
VLIPRTAQTQFNAGPRVSSGQPVLLGDLVFFGTSPRAVSHMGIAISATEMIDAPTLVQLYASNRSRDRIWLASLDRPIPRVRV